MKPESTAALSPPPSVLALALPRAVRTPAVGLLAAIVGLLLAGDGHSCGRSR